MKLFCTLRFAKEYRKLCSKKAYKDLPQLIINYFQNKSIEEIASGGRIFDIKGRPWIKKRLGGAGRFRIDYVLIENEEEAFLIFIYPKVGPNQAADLKLEFRKELLKEFQNILDNKEYLEVKFQNGQLLFNQIS